MQKDDAINVFDEPLEPCSEDPVTGYFRDGHCNTCKEDFGSHTVCIKITTEFLEYSRFKGNDLSTPMPEYGFKGLKPNDAWCLCADRWLQAYKNNAAPKLHLMRTHKCALDIIPIELMKKFAADLN